MIPVERLLVDASVFPSNEYGAVGKSQRPYGLGYVPISIPYLEASNIPSGNMWLLRYLDHIKRMSGKPEGPGRTFSSSLSRLSSQKIFPLNSCCVRPEDHTTALYVPTLGDAQSGDRTVSH